MKEASGELNMTVITIVAIAAIAAIFTVFLLPRLRGRIDNASKCASATCLCDGPGTCTDCTFINEDGNAENVTCVLTDGN